MDTNKYNGMQFDQYLIEKHLARGGMADVYLARDVSLNRQVAIKILLDALAQDPQFILRFQREARAVARLDHPGIVQVYSTGVTSQGQPYIAMQYISGGSLRDLLRDWAAQNKVAPAAQALAVAHHLASALNVAHQAGIVHRDLKPSNVLIRSDGMPVLVDLGIAAMRGSDRLTQTGALMGTPHYMSPEQVKGAPLDGRSDIYSLGVILYEMLAGIRPFEADESIAILHKHVYEAPVPLEQLRGGLTPQTLQLVNICLEKEPDGRYQNAGELLAAIDAALAAEGTGGYVPRTTVLLPDGEADLLSKSRYRPPAPQAAAPGGKGTGRRNLLIAGGILGVLLLLLFGAIGMGGLGGESPTQPATLSATPPTQATEDKQNNVVSVGEPTATAETAPETTPTKSPTPTNTPTSQPPTETPTPESRYEIARSAGGIPIEVVRFGTGPKKVLLVGGISAGYSPGSVAVTNRAITYFDDNPGEIPENVTLLIIPSLNPDSPLDPGKRNGRFNANGVDLNRNWACDWAQDADVLGRVYPNSGGTEPFSEPEVAGLRDLILEESPDATIFWTSQSANGLVSPGLCGNRSIVSTSLANTYGLGANYPVLELEGTQGDASNWLDQQGFPAIFAILPDYSGYRLGK